MLHNIISQIYYKLIYYIKGCLEVFKADTPRYSFTIKDINLKYNEGKLQTDIICNPVGSSKTLTQKATDLLESHAYYLFKKEHIKLIVGIATLEKSLDLSKKEHLEIFKKYLQNNRNLLV